jgi:CRISPR-associated protein Cas2
MWLVCFDIRAPRRWRRVTRVLRGVARRVQWSVYLLSDTEDVDALYARLSRLLNPREDDLRIYRLVRGRNIEMHGRALHVRGVHLARPTPRHRSVTFD